VNGVVGVSVKAKACVTLLFWNGLEDQALIPLGQFRGAQLTFQGVDHVNTRLLKKGRA